MHFKSRTAFTAALVALAVGAFAIQGFADDGSLASRTEVTLMGGIQSLNKNDTAFPDRFINVPVVAGVAYHASRVLAVEGEFTWMIPVSQTVNFGSGSGDMKTPNILAYQANLRADLPVNNPTWAPYVAAGAGAITFLSNSDQDVYPALSESQTVFGINFGAGVNYGLTSNWGLRADFREFVAFPQDDTAGLSTGGQADPIWMPRGTLGVAYRF